MHALHMVSLAESFNESLPVAGERHRKVVGAGIVAEVGPLADLGDDFQPVCQRFAVGIQVDEHERPPGVHRHWEQREIVIAQRAETLAAGDFPELAVKRPRPAVIHASDVLQAFARARAEHIAAMPAHILKRPDDAVVAAHYQHRELADVIDEVVARVCHMRDAASQLPHFRPHSVCLQCGEFGRDVAVSRHLCRRSFSAYLADSTAHRSFVGYFVADLDSRHTEEFRKLSNARQNRS